MSDDESREPTAPEALNGQLTPHPSAPAPVAISSDEGQIGSREQIRAAADAAWQRLEQDLRRA
jgi:hypothetical protein